MSDNLGPLNSLHRVLDSTNRNFESVIYQYQKPPLSSEVNLTGSIDSVRSQEVLQALTPSGWLAVGSIKDSTDAVSFQAGDLLCSDTLANTIKLVTQDFGQDTGRNIALINGWKIKVQGSSSPHSGDYNPNATTDENCLITLPTPPDSAHTYNFIFLEAWRQLVTTSDPIYKYGNVDYFGNNFANDLIDPARGFETSLRVQIQYRIRVAKIDDAPTYPDGFCPTVFAQGPNVSAPLCSDGTFSPVPGDPGLWVAGAGSDLDKENFGTVDGFIYAIPMFIVSRRNSKNFSINLNTNGAAYNLAGYNNLIPSDRPDGLYNDLIVANDIVDFRHKVVSEESLDSLCADAFKALQDNSLKTKMVFSTVGEDHAGPVLMNVDFVGPKTWNVNTWSHPIGSGNNVDGTGALGQRWFANASGIEKSAIVRTINDKSLGTIGANWATSDQFTIDLDAMQYPSGAMLTRVGPNISTADFEALYPVNFSTTPSIIDGVGAVNPPSRSIMFTNFHGGYGDITDTSEVLRIYFDVTYPAGTGLTAVPIQYLEARQAEPSTKEAMELPIAIKGQDIPVRYGSASVPVGTSDGTFNNMLQARGGNYTHSYDFGHQMVYHIQSQGTNLLNIDRIISGYNIIGLADIKVDGVSKTFTAITRDANQFHITLSASVTAGKNIEVTLYTDSKYFECNKQGRGIIECYRMIELTPTGVINGSNTAFTIDGFNKPILALGSYSTFAGLGYAYENGTLVNLTTNNNTLPMEFDSNYEFDQETSVDITFATAPVAGPLTVPVLVKSAIEKTEGFYFFYNTNAYQGRANTLIQEVGPEWPVSLPAWPVMGSIETVGPAITTTAGSGAIVNYKYSQGQIYLNGTTTVLGVDTNWANNVNPGQFLTIENYSVIKHLITEVYDSTLILAAPTSYNGGPSNYVIEAVDQPTFSSPNIFDRFPTLNAANDSSGKNEGIQTAVSDLDPVLETRIISRTQDMISAPVNTVQFGLNGAARGQTTINIPDAKLGVGSLGLKFENTVPGDDYKKTYQSYILNKDNSGRLYLMVTGTETDNTGTNKCFLNAYSTSDSVDLYELPGRPLLANRTK